MFSLFLFSAFSFAAPSSVPASVPVVSVADFSVGRSWTWDYVASDGSPWSTERYTVVGLQGSVVTLEIASDYGGAQNLKPNTRVRADVARCLAAYSSKAAKKPWSMQMFSLSAGRWTEFDAPSTLAFEEKFNCNAHVFSGASEPYATVFSVVDGISVFQQKLWRRLTASWFGAGGFAFAKDFDTGYRFRLRPSMPK